MHSTTPSAPLQRPGCGRLLIDNFEELISVALLCIIIVVMSMQVVLRTVFSSPLSWPEELSQFLFVWCSAFGAVGAAKRYGLVCLEGVVAKLPAGLRALVDYLVLALIIALMGVVGWEGWQLTTRTSFSAASLPVTWAWLYAAAPVASILMIVRLIQLRVFRYRFEVIEAFIVTKAEGINPQSLIL